jgi:hypothetical protein
MRFASAILISLSAAGLTPALADPPENTAAAASQPATPATNAAPAPTSAPAQAAPTSSQPAATAVKTVASTTTPPAKTQATSDLEERQLMDLGYTPEMHNGTKLWCKRLEEIGSRLGSRQKTCGTAHELTLLQRQAQEQFGEKAATYSTGPGK